MLTESSLFFLNLCNEYSDLQQAKATSGLSDAWVKQVAATKTAKRRRSRTEDSDDGDATPTPEATSSATSRPSKKRISNSGVAVAVHERTLPLKKLRKGSTSTSGAGNSEKVRDEEPANVQNSSRYGGLEDEDDEEEWRVIKQSPVKERGVRVSDHVRRRYVRSWTPC